MKISHFGAIGLLVFCLPLVASGQERERALPHLQLQVAALTQIQDFQFTPEQLQELKRIAAKVTPGKVKSAGHLRPEFTTALNEYRRALIEGDPEKMATAQQKVEDARDKEKGDPEPTVDLSETARLRAPEVVALLTPIQIAQYLAAHLDEVTDPLQTMLDSLEEIPGKSDAEYAILRKSVSETVADVIYGMNSTDQDKIAEKVGNWLDGARAINESELATRHTVLEKSAREIVGHPNPMDCLKHWVERDLADLLSNPDLPRVLTERIRTGTR